MMSMVGAAIARILVGRPLGQAAFIWVTFSISLGQSPGLGRPWRSPARTGCRPGARA